MTTKGANARLDEIRRQIQLTWKLSKNFTTAKHARQMAKIKSLRDEQDALYDLIACSIDAHIAAALTAIASA